MSTNVSPFENLFQIAREIGLESSTSFDSESEESSDEEIRKIYGFDSARSSPIDESTEFSVVQKGTIVGEKFVNSSKIESLVERSSPKKFWDDEFYRDYLDHHPDLRQDSSPEIVEQPNDNEVLYKQPVSIRFLVPPTPPPPGPLIIRETRSPSKSPSPLIVEQKSTMPRTPSPIIIREQPPTPPIENQQTTLPEKPQSIIIEKWLPYKEAPAREIIYERVVEMPLMTTFQPRNSTSTSSIFERFAQSTQREIERMQRQTDEQIEFYRKMNKSQNHENFPMTTPVLVVNYQPVTRFIGFCPLEQTNNYSFYSNSY